MALDLDERERAELCDLFDELGPDSPTLSGAWTTADLAAHLVVRERDLIGAPGILLSPLAGLTERRMAATLAKHGYAEVVELVRTGPPFGPMRIGPVRRLVNLVEFFVHHEDVRRANGRGPRTDRPDLQAGLWDVLGRMAPLMLGKARVRGIELRLVADTGEVRAVGKGSATVTLIGPPAELVLELYGRRSVATVAYEGPEEAVARVQGAEFGI